MFYVDVAKCTGCGSCIETCPQGAISLQGNKANINNGLCTECGSCWNACPNNAICEIMSPAITRKQNLKPDRVGTNTGAPTANKKIAGIKTLASLVPVVVEVISAFASNKRNSSGRGRGKLYNCMGRSIGRQCHRRGRK